MSSETDGAAPTPPAKARGRRSRLVFIGVILAAVIVVYLIQVKPPSRLKGWGTDLPAILQQAKAEGRPVLVLFHSSPAG